LEEKQAIEELWLESDVIVYDCLENLSDTVNALERIESLIDQFSKPKTFLLLSTVLTWAKTKVNEDDEEAAFAEDEYRKRKPHPNCKEHANLEKLIVKLSKKEMFKGYVVCPGLVYHAGDSIFHSLLKQAWHNAESLKCYGEGSNILPCIHLDDLTNIVVEVIELQPENRYIVATDDSKSSYYEIVKAISDQLGNGRVIRCNKEDAFLDSTISQLDYDLLTCNIRIEPGWIKEHGVELKFEAGIIENLPSIVQEFRDARGLWPIKIMVHGPPGSGKTYYSKKMAEHYALHYIEPEELVQQTISELEFKLLNASALQAQQEEEIDFDSIRSELQEIKDQIRNAGHVQPEMMISLIRNKLRSMPCRNQGYVLDGYPTTTDEANDLLRPLDDEAADRSTPIVDDLISPEFVFTLEMSDTAIRHRFMKLPDKNEEVLNKRLEEYRKLNTDEITVLNFFDELEIVPFTLQVEILETSQVMKHVLDQVGGVRNYGPSMEQIQQQLLKEEEQRREHERLMQEDQARREKEENARHAKIQQEWVQ
jgi:adenylate kinase